MDRRCGPSTPSPARSCSTAPRPPRLVADRLPLLRRARREVLATLGGETLPEAETLDGVVVGRDPRGANDPDARWPGGRRLPRGSSRPRDEIDFDGLAGAGAAPAPARTRPPASSGRRRFSHVLVDEFQDVDATQLELVALLAEPERNLFVVGDDDQTIYAWRLADVRRILEFPSRYPDATRIVLETNYRCPAVVVAAADRLISRNRERVPKELRAAEPAGDPQDAILTWPLRGPESVTRLAAALPRWADEHGRVAVLARTRAELGPLLACPAARRHSPRHGHPGAGRGGVGDRTRG